MTILMLVEHIYAVRILDLILSNALYNFKDMLSTVAWKPVRKLTLSFGNKGQQP